MELSRTTGVTAAVTTVTTVTTAGEISVINIDSVAYSDAVIAILLQ